MSQPKIVSLELRSRQKSAIPPVLHSLRQQSKRHLNELIQTLFNNSDDAFFELADRSRSDLDQNLFFESMRQLRLQRKEISNQFIAGFYNSFEQAFQVDDDSEEADFETTVDNISLVNNDDLEVSVAIAGIVSKVTSQFSLPVMQLTRRIDHLCDCRTITERLNPLGPERLSAVFVDSIKCLEFDIKVLIILLKLYERFVMERMGPIFEEANNLLIDAGVLPDLKDVHRKKRNQRTQRGEANFADVESENLLSAGSNGQLAGNGFGVIQSLLAATRDETATSSAGDTISISTSQLLSALSAAQVDVHAGPIDIERLPPTLDLRQLVVAKATGNSRANNANIRQADEDVVNFVGMLFDYILNDRNLAIPMKALIARLQIPIVKIAIVDNSFFEKSNHPARQLLNELSSAGIGWSSAAELKRDAMYNKVESIVKRILSGSMDDTGLFPELLTELRAWVNTDQRRRDRVEQRVKESERGKAKTTDAKQTVQQLINQKASGMRLPPAVGLFISDIWSKVLVYLCIKSGTTSSEWHTSVQVLDNLLWCLQPMANLDDLNKRDEILPELISQLRAGMDVINLQATACNDQIESLKFQLEKVSQHDRDFLEEDTPENDTFAQDFEELDEIVLTETISTLGNSDAAPVGEKFLNQIKKLQEGTWVEMVQEDGTRLRCRLAAVLQPGNKHVFVNRRGMKVAQKSSVSLAADLEQNSLIILDESQVFDRALQAVIGNLRQLRTSTSV